MKRLICVAVVVVLLTGSVACIAAEDKAWRFGASWVRLSDTDVRNVLGDGWGIGAEYSFGDTFTDLTMPMDLSVAVSYKRFDDTFFGVGVSLDHTSVGLKWRAGSGASPAADGFYGGVGLGAAFLRAKVGVIDDSKTRFEWSVFGGANFAQSWYGEIGYNHVGDIEGTNLSNWAVTVGHRF